MKIIKYSGVQDKRELGQDDVLGRHAAEETDQTDF